MISDLLVGWRQQGTATRQRYNRTRYALGKKSRNRKNELVSDMSYQEWAGWKEKEQKTVAESIENSENSGKIQVDSKMVDSRYCTNSEYSDAVKLHGKNISKEDKKQIEWNEKADGSNGGYVTSRNYSVINSHLRGDGFAEKLLDEDDRKTIDALRRAITNNTLGGDYTLTRYLNADYISNVFGIMDDDGTRYRIDDVFISDDGLIEFVVAIL